MLGLVLLIGLVSGVVLVAAAGARRTSTAYPRLLRWASAAQLDLIPGQPRAGYTGNGRTGYYAAVARLPQVASVSAVDLLGMAVQPPHGPPDITINTTGSLDATTGRTVNRVRVLAGRLYDPADPHAVMIDQRMARLAHVGPGGTLHVLAIPGFTSAHPDLRGEKRLALRVSASSASPMASCRTTPGRLSRGRCSARPSSGSTWPVAIPGWRSVTTRVSG